MLKYVLAFIFSSNVFANYSDQASDYLVIGMTISPFAYGLHKNDKKMLLASGVSHLSTFGATQLAKSVTKRERPDHSGFDSFWSGHTVHSAVSAGIFCRENKKYCIPFAGLALTTAGLRILAKKHFWEDTAIGFFVGFNSGYAIPGIFFNF